MRITTPCVHYLFLQDRHQVQCKQPQAAAGTLLLGLGRGGDHEHPPPGLGPPVGTGLKDAGQPLPPHWAQQTNSN